MTSFLSWLENSSTYLQKSWVIGIVTLTIGGFAAGLLLMIRYSRRTNKAFWIIGLLFLAWSLGLFLAKFYAPKAKVPSTALVWALAIIGIALLLASSLLRRQRLRTVHSRIDGFAASIAEHTDTLIKDYNSMDFFDLMTYGSKPVIPLISSLMHPRRRGRCTVLLGQPWSGRTATLLNSAMVLQQSRSAYKRPLIAMYIDLDEYATQTTRSLSLGEFIHGKFPELNKIVAETGRDVRWVFLFDNADEADRRWEKEKSWDSVTSFIHQRSRLAPFYAVVATCMSPEEPDRDYVVRIGALSRGGLEKLLIHAGVNQAVMDELVKDKSLYWYLTNPGALKLLAPVLERSTWTTSDNVHKAMGDAIELRLQGQSQSLSTNPSSLQATAMATIELLQTYRGFVPDAAVKIGDEELTHIAEAIDSSQEQIKENLTALGEYGIIKWTLSGQHAGWVQFSPVIGAYFYTCVLLERPSAIPVGQLLGYWHFRLTVVSLLKMVGNEVGNEGNEIVKQFIGEAGHLLKWAIEHLPPEPTPSDTVSSDTPPDQAELDRMTYRTYVALSVLVEGLQNRLELLDEELREKSIEFTKRATFKDPRTLADLLKLSYSLGTREQTISTMKIGLEKQYGTRLFDTARRMVNTISESEVTELDDACRSKLVRVITMVGLRSFNGQRRRDDMPSIFQLADSARTAAIIVYGTLFGFGGLLQLFYWHDPLFHSYPFPQICEILAAMLVVSPMAIARYRPSSHKFLLGQYFESIMRLTNRFLALVGAVYIIVIVLYSLGKFTLPLMPLLVCYSLVWPACVLSYLASDRDPKATNVVFPLLQVFHMLSDNRSWSDLG